MKKRFIVVSLCIFFLGLLCSVYREKNGISLSSFVTGQVVYALRGQKGVFLCAKIHWLGCFDGLISQIKRDSKKGEKIDAPCRVFLQTPQSYSYCVTGVGHGLFTDLKIQSADDFTKGLTVCKDLSVDPNLCFKSMLDAGSRQIAGRSLSVSIDTLCSQLAQENQPNCYFYGPRVWRSLSKLSVSDLGSKCGALTWSRNREECFGGIARLLTDIPGYSIQTIEKQCGYISTSEGRVFCTIESMRSMFVDHKTKPLALCGRLEGQYKNICLTAGKQFACHIMLDCSDNEPPSGITINGVEIKTIGYNSPESEKISFNRAVNTAAQQTNAIEISDTCEMSPGVAAVDPASPIRVKNNGPYNRDISFAEETYRVALGQSVSVTVHMNEGIYGVSCDGLLKGYLLVR